MIIQNQRQYRSTKTELARFEQGLIAHDAREPHDLPSTVDPGMPQLMHDAIASWIETLREQIDHYEKLRDGYITSREITSLHELPTALIEARIARETHPTPTRRTHRCRRAADPALGGQRLLRRQPRPPAEHRRRARRTDPRDDHLQ